MKNRIFQYPCAGDPDAAAIIKVSRDTSLQAIFERKFIWRAGSKGNITITFGTSSCGGCSEDAAWSQVGNDSSKSTPSMNLGFIDPPFQDFTFDGQTFSIEEFRTAIRNYCETNDSGSCKPNWVAGATVIHEFGHALGMLHEHQNNMGSSNTIQLNKDAVLSYYAGIGMTPEDAEANVLKFYTGSDQYIGSKFDPESIMLYALPDDWVIGPNPTKPNFKLSATDILWLSNMYAKTTDYPQLTITFIDTGVPKWKEAWVQKMVIEELLPHVNIGMRFITSDGKDKTVVPDVLYNVPTPKQASMKVLEFETFENISETNKSVLIGVSVSFCVMILVVIGFAIMRKKKK